MSDEFEPALASIIIPTYNRAKLAGEAVRSVCEQSHRPLEILLVDDGSSDNTAQETGEWRAYCEQQGVSFRFFQQPNRGAPTARNRGLIESRGEFIQFLDSDDLLDADKLEVQIRALRAQPAAAVCYGLTQYYDADGTPTQRFGKPPAKSPVMDAVVAGFDCIAPLYRRVEIVRTGPWDETLKCLQNWEHRARFLLQFGPGIFLDRPVCSHRLHSGERISDHGNLTFLQGYLEAVLKVERLVRAVAPDETHAFDHLSRETLAVFKSLLAVGGRGAERRETAHRALSESHRLASGRRRHLLRLLLVAYQIMPARLVARLLHSMSRFRRPQTA